MKKVFNTKKFVIIGVVVVVVLVAIIYFWMSGDKNSGLEFADVVRSDLWEEVSVTGKIEPASEVSLAFEKTGRVAAVYKDVGDTVKAGDVLVSLDNSEAVTDLERSLADVRSAEALLKQYEAALAVQVAKLDEYLVGTRPEQLEVYRAKAENAKVALGEAKKSLEDKLDDAYTKSDDAVRNRTDQLFSNPRTNPQINFNLSDTQLKNKIESGRSSLESVFLSWSSSLAKLNDGSDFDFYVSEAENNLDSVKDFLDNMASAVNSLTAAGSLTQTTIDAWRLDISTARTNVNTAISSLSSAVEKHATYKTALTIAENELLLQKAGATAEQIAAQMATVKQAEANADSQRAQIAQAEARVTSARLQVNKNTMRTPIDGVVTKQDSKTGQIVAANVVLVSIISEADFEIVANIPEADIAKIKIGDNARLTLDAYGDSAVFNARVAKIDPAEIVTEGVATYKTTLVFNEKDTRPKSGMTANLDIITEERNGVLSVPFRAVYFSGTRKYVKVLENEKIIEKDVTTGTRGANGNIEITGGLNEGEKVVVYENSK